MRVRICTLLCFAVAVATTTAAQSDPVLLSANMPKHPPLACQARIGGLVKLTFALAPKATEPTDVQAVSGPKLLKDAAVENVKTWRFQNPYAVRREYETTFDFQFPTSGPQKITFESFHKVEVVTCVPVNWQP